MSKQVAFPKVYTRAVEVAVGLLGCWAVGLLGCWAAELRTDVPVYYIRPGVWVGQSATYAALCRTGESKRP